MKPPRLDLQANSAAELRSQLAKVDIAVPFYTKGRTTCHREQYMMARLLATIADTNHISFPLRVEHREKPDFSLHFPNETVGVECVEATHAEWAHIQAIRERDSPETLVSPPRLKPGQQKFTLEERIAIARGENAGPLWVGKMPQHLWAEVHAHFVSEKTAKLRAGNYAEFRRLWLLVQDEWPVPLYRFEERREAAELCASSIQPSLHAPAFSNIYICNSEWLVRLVPGPVDVCAIHNIWN